MKFLRFPISFFSVCSVTIFAAFFAAGPAYAQGTSSSIRVEVTNPDGSAVGGVEISVTHRPTGRVQTMTSNAQGHVTARGLAVGGPYEVSVVSGNQYAADVMQGIFVELDKTEVVELMVRPVIEEILVTAKTPTGEVAVGVGRAFDRATIDATPSISRDFVSALATDPQILVDKSEPRGPAVSLAGQNFRLNSVTVDGIPQNDNFGLSRNASATLRSPVSIDAIEAISVNMAPYDATYGNFVGGNINIVTKSGTNEFHGSAFYFNTDDSLTGDKSDGSRVDVGDFSEDVYGFTLGGPIVRDKLFFFANYEKFETTRPANAQTIDAIAGVTQADLDRFISILETEYGYLSHGDFAVSDDDEDEKVLIKLDWNINDDHRGVLTYQTAEGDVIFDDFPTLVALQSNRYNINEKLTSFSAQLFSNWTENFSTEIKIGTKEVENRQVSVDTSVPEFIVTAPGGGTLQAGGDRFRQNNILDNESDIFRIKGDYVVGDHQISGGWERESKTNRNIFTPGTRGVFFFASLDDLENRVLDFALHGGAPDGQSADKKFTLDIDSFFIQDEWTPTSDLTLTFGLRYDTLSNDTPILENSNFVARQGFSNTENLDGKDLVQPRFGFDWDATDRLTVRGGAGLFGGGAPLIILSNSYIGDGISRNFLNFYAPFFGPPVSDALDSVLAALPDPNAANTFLQPFNTVSPEAQVDAIDPGYDILSTWKYSVGLDYLADLSGIKLGDDWQFSADFIFSDVNDGYDIYEARRTVDGTAPDGRRIYDFPANGDYITRNTGEGRGTVITVNAAKIFDTDWGTFDFKLGYTYQDVEELRSYNRFVTFETLVFDPGTDVNNPGVAPSRYEIENRWTGTLTWQNRLFRDNLTTAGLVWEGRNGRHYSYVFGSSNAAFGGTLFADFGSEGDNPGSQLFYVPTGTNDPIVTGDPAFLADLDSFISSEGCLNGSRGSIVGRNACESDWINIFSLRLAQEINVRDYSFDLLLDIENIGNLLNDDWGRIDGYTAPSNVVPAVVAIDGTGTQYIYTPNPSYDPAIGATSIVPAPEVSALASVYRIQLGVRFRF